MRKIIPTSYRRVIGLAVLVMVGAGAAAGIALSASSPGLSPANLPAAKQAVLDRTWPPPNAAPPAPRDPSAVPAAPAQQPPPDAGQIELASKTALEVPAATDVLTPSSGWADVRDGNLIEIFAGSSAQDPTGGAIFVADTNQQTGLPISPSGLYKAPSGIGPLTLTAVNGQTVSFVTQGGIHGTFDLGTKAFTTGG